MTDSVPGAGRPTRIRRRGVQALRRYTFHSPLRRGKLRLAQVGMRYAADLPGERLVPTVDGRRLYADLSTGMSDLIYFLGEYERAVTRVVRSIVRPGDVCLDIGANMGWYTTLLHELAGPSGEVHAFEPVPAIFAALDRNVALLDQRTNVHLRNLALGDSPGAVPIHLFAGLPNGHASMSDMGRDDAETVEVALITLDSYLDAEDVAPVDVVKMDIEGAELGCLRGAERLFAQDDPPIWVIEMALATTRGFGYLPEDLVQFLQTRARHDLYAVDDLSGQVRAIEGFAPTDIGANVLCIPEQRRHRFDPTLLAPFPRGR